MGLLLLYLIVTKRLKLLLRIRVGVGALAFLVTALPWHILAALQNAASGSSRGWFWFYFVNDQVNRYLNKRIPRDYDKVPLATFCLLLILWVMPWSVFLLDAVRQWWTKHKVTHSERAQLLFLLWALFIVGFFSLSTRQEYYTLPAVPALALLVGVYLADEEAAEKRSSWLLAASSVLFVVGVTVASVCTYLFLVARTPPPGTELYQALIQHPEDYALSFGHFFDLTKGAFGFFRAPLLGMAVSMIVLCGLSFWFRLKRYSYAANLTIALGMCAVLTCVHAGLMTFYPILGSEPLARSIQQHWRTGDKVVLDGEYSNGSSINFYLGEPVYMLNGRVNNLWYGSLYADAPHRFETTESFLQLWNGPQRIFLVTHDAARTKAWQLDHGGTLVSSSAGKYVLLNRID